MPNQYDFFTTEPSTGASVWWLAAIAMSCIPMVINSHNLLPHLMMAVVILAINLFIVLLPFKRPLQVTIDTEAKQLHYRYENCFGREGVLIINLGHVWGYYEREMLGKFKTGWHLVLYNHWGLYRKLSIKEGDGYTQEQLDQIVKLVHQCKAV
jgi:hypothetical protein